MLFCILFSLDELPMIYTSCILAYCMYEVQSPPKRENVMLASALTILSVLFTMTHVYHKVPLIFFVSTYIFNYLFFQLVEKSALKNFFVNFLDFQKQIKERTLYCM